MDCVVTQWYFMTYNKANTVVPSFSDIYQRIPFDTITDSIELTQHIL